MRFAICGLALAIFAANCFCGEETTKSSMATTNADIQSDFKIGDKVSESWLLTKEDFQLMSRAEAIGATAFDAALATDICSKKCKICYDGKKCDYDCARKSCSGKTR